MGETHFFTILYRAEILFRLIATSGPRTIEWTVCLVVPGGLYVGYHETHYMPEEANHDG